MYHPYFISRTPLLGVTSHKSGIPFLFYFYSVSNSILFYSIISYHIKSYPIISFHFIHPSWIHINHLIRKTGMVLQNHLSGVGVLLDFLSSILHAFKRSDQVGMRVEALNGMYGGKSMFFCFFHVGNGFLARNMVEHIPWKSWVMGFLSHGYACIIVYWERKKPVPLVSIWCDSKWIFYCLVGRHLTPDRVTWPSKKGHKELPGMSSYPPVGLVFWLVRWQNVLWRGWQRIGRARNVPRSAP